MAAAAPGQRGPSTHCGARGSGGGGGCGGVGASATVRDCSLLRPPARPHETGDWAASGPATAEEEEVGEEEARAELEEERPAPTVLCGVAARQPTRQPCGT